jgi:predicted outer membrane protein
VIAAGLTCLLAVYSVAQQIETREEASDRAQSGQIDRSQTQQRDRSTTQDVDRFDTAPRTAQLGQRDARAGGQESEVEKFLASCLLAKNEAEVELSQFAQQQAENPQVKQFAQQMVQDHRQIIQQLQPLAAMQGAGERTGAIRSPGASGQFDAQRQPSDTTRLPGSPGAAQRDLQSATNTAQTGGSSDAGDAIQKLVQIDRQIVERHKEAVREELQQKQGAEFDKCYLGVQIGSHMHMLAALETIEQQQQGRLAQLAQQNTAKVRQHLDEAKQLMEQLDQDGARPGAARAQRPQPRTQR